MNDHNLDDLIIDTDTPKQSKAKGFLTIIALLIVVLIVAIILTKIILKEPDIQSPELAENNTEIISPELTLQDTEEVLEEESDLSKMIESEIESPTEPQPSNEEVKKETVTIEENKQTYTTPATVPAVKAEKPQVPAKTAPATQDKTKSSPEKPHTNPIKKKIQPATQSTSLYYVQVGSFSKTPSADSHLISAIRKNGYHYTLYKAPNGMKKVLIGPYKSRAQADKAIIRIKDRINKSAFVFTK